VNFYKLIAMIILVCFCAINTAQAYIGPGAAVVFLGYIFGPIIAVVVSVGLIFAWIGRLVWKKKSRKKHDKDIQKVDNESKSTDS
jgi:uncharacterized membrane protein